MGFWGVSNRKVGTEGGGVYDRGPGWASVATLSLMMVVSALFFNNCSNEFTVKGPSTVDLASLLSVCEGRIFREFERQVLPFAKGEGRCVSCHAGPTDSPDPFAAEDKLRSFEAFQFIGIKTLKSFGINAGHAPGITGPQHAAVLQAAEDSITAAENDPVCKGDGPALKSARTIAKTVNAPVTENANQGLVVRWTLESEIESGDSDLGGATFEATIHQFTRAGGQPTYYITRPTISTGAAPIELRGIYVWINGLKISLGTTFSEVDVLIPAGTANLRLSNATLLQEMPDGITANDTIAFSFDHIQRTDTNPPITPTPTPTPPPGGGGGGLNGAAFYASNCAGCHGQLANSNQRGATAQEITNAIAGVPVMMNIRLTPQEIEAIATALR